MSVIIPEGIRSLYMNLDKELKSENVSGIGHVHEPPDHTRKIGLSLVLGFVFMILVDQLSQKHGSNTSSDEKNITATIGLVVHAAGKYTQYLG